MQIVLEGKNLQECADQARDFIADFEANIREGNEVSIEGAATAEPPKRGRGRPPKVAPAPAAAAPATPPADTRTYIPVCEAHLKTTDTAKFNPTLVQQHHCTPCKAPGTGQLPPAANNAMKAGVPAEPKVEEVQQAMRELIAFKGNGDPKVGAPFAAELLKTEFAPATRATEIPKADWPRFIARVMQLTVSAAPAADPAGSLI